MTVTSTYPTISGNLLSLNGITGKMTLLRGIGIDTVITELSRMLREGIEDSTVRRLAEQITVGQTDKIGAVFDFVRANFPYQPDPENIELFIHPRRMAQDYYEGRFRQGDCDDHALWNAALLGSIGYKTRILIVDSNLDGELDHALAQVETDKGWLNFDTTSSRPLFWEHTFGQVVAINP